MCLDTLQSDESSDYGFINSEELVANAARKINAKIVRLEDLERYLRTRSDQTENNLVIENDPEEVTPIFRTLFGVSFPVSFIDTELFARSVKLETVKSMSPE